MNRYFAIFTTLTSILCAEIQFSSDEVSSKDGEISLKGNVHIKHDIGTISAKKAILKKGELPENSSYQSVFLNDSVEILLSTNQVLTSQNAKVDFEGHRATLSSDSEKICFSDPKHQIEIQCKKIDCKWDEKQDSTKLTSLAADQSVAINYGSDVLLKADSATFTPDESGTSLLKLNDAYSNTPCTIVLGNDQLSADSATINLNEETLLVHKPIGKIETNMLNTPQREEVSFTSNTLNWDRKSGEISLSEQVLVAGKSFGNLLSNKTVSFSTEKVDEKVLFKGFSTTGESQLITDQGMKISCDGNIDFNLEEMTLCAQSIDTPILYQNDDFIIEAENISIEDFQKITQTVSFLDNVTFSTGTMMGNAGGITFKPKEHTLEFYSTDKEDVVFYNKENDTKMRASRITITQDPDSKENEIKGHGVVTLTFDHQDREKIIEVFNSCAKQHF